MILPLGFLPRAVRPHPPQASSEAENGHRVERERGLSWLSPNREEPGNRQETAVVPTSALT
jgi:hypothetical protein